MENYLIAAIVAIGTALVTIFGLLMKAYKAVGDQKDLRLKDRHKAEEEMEVLRDLRAKDREKAEKEMETLRDKHGSDLEDIKKLILGKADDEPS